MADNFADMVTSKTVKNQVNIQRWGEGLRKNVYGLLVETQDEILREVASGLTPTARPLTEWKRARMVALRKQIDNILDTQYGKIKTLSSSQLTTLAATTAVGEAKMINGLLGAELFEVTLTEPMLRNLVNHTMIDGAVIGKWWDGQKDNFSKRFERQLNDAAQAIQIGTIKGEAVGEIVRRIRGTATVPGIMNVSRREATALVRTSTMQVANASRFEMYEANKDLINGYQVSATLDLRTTLMCQGYDGETFYYDPTSGTYINEQGLSWLGPPPFHWNCRTTLIPLLKSFADLAGPRSKLTRKQIEGMEKKLDSGMRATMHGPAKKVPYSEWLKKQSASDAIEALGVGRYKLWKEYGLSSADLLHQNGRAITTAQLRRKLNVGASAADVKSFINEHGLQAVSPARVRRFLDDCF